MSGDAVGPPSSPLQRALRVAQRIDVWVLDSEKEIQHVKELEALLSNDERARGQALLRPYDRERHIVAHALLRQVLSLYTGSQPDELSFELGVRGKPMLRSRGISPIHFSLASSGDVTLIAVAACPLGVDIERILPLEDLLPIARLLFAASEVGYIAGLDGADQLPAFYRCWTRKEALVKATGEGLSAPLNTFDVRLDSDEMVDIQAGNASETWTLYHLDPAPGYVGALAVLRGPHRLATTMLSYEDLLASLADPRRAAGALPCNEYGHGLCTTTGAWHTSLLSGTHHPVPVRTLAQSGKLTQPSGTVTQGSG